MSEKVPETAESPGTDQTDAQVRLLLEIPNKNKFQPAEEFTANDKHPNSTTEIERDIAQDAEDVQHEEANLLNQSMSKTRVHSENYQSQSKHTVEKIMSNLWAVFKSILDRDSISGSSKVSYDKTGDISESSNRSKHRNERIRDYFVFNGDRADRTKVEVDKSDTRSQNDIDPDINKITEYPSPYVLNTEESRSEVPNLKDRTYNCSSCGKVLIKNYNKNPNQSQLEHRDKLKNGCVNMRLHSPVSQRTGKSNIQPCNTQECQKEGQRDVDRLIKTTGIKQTDNQCADPFKNRGIVKARSKDSENPRSNLLKGVMYSGGDEIEYLTEESPEQDVLTTPSFPSELVPRSMAESLVSVYFCELIVYTKKWVEEKIAKAPVFYVISTVTILISAILLARRLELYDIFSSIILTLVYCIVFTCCVDRGKWAKTVEEMGENNVLLPNQNFYEKPLCSDCFRRQPQIKRHSQYYHRDDETNTAFVHEIADVSNIDPEDYPHIKMVEQENMDSGSPDDLSSVNADIYAPGTSKNSVKVAAISTNCSQVLFKKRTKSHYKVKSKSSSAPLKSPQSCEAEIHNSRFVNKPESDRSFVATDRSKASSNKLRKSNECSLPELTETCATETFDTENEHNREEFICEHYGKSIACSCALYFRDRYK